MRGSTPLPLLEVGVFKALVILMTGLYLAIILIVLWIMGERK